MSCSASNAFCASLLMVASIRSMVMLVAMEEPSAPTDTTNTPVHSGQMAEKPRFSLLLVWPCIWVMAS